MTDIIFMHIQNKVSFIKIWIPFFFNITNILVVIIAVAVIIVITGIVCIVIIVIYPWEFATLLT